MVYIKVGNSRSASQKDYIKKVWAGCEEATRGSPVPQHQWWRGEWFPEPRESSVKRAAGAVAGCSQPTETMGLVPHSTHLMQTWQEARPKVAFWNHSYQHPGPQSSVEVSGEWIWKSQQKIPSDIKHSSPSFIPELTEVQRGEVSHLRLHNWRRTGPGFSSSLSESRAWASDWPSDQNLFLSFWGWQQPQKWSNLTLSLRDAWKWCLSFQGMSLTEWSVWSFFLFLYLRITVRISRHVILISNPQRRHREGQSC